MKKFFALLIFHGIRAVLYMAALFILGYAVYGAYLWWVPGTLESRDALRVCFPAALGFFIYALPLVYLILKLVEIYEWAKHNIEE
jgi:hypothetical protein